MTEAPSHKIPEETWIVCGRYNIRCLEYVIIVMKAFDYRLVLNHLSPLLGKENLEI